MKSINEKPTEQSIYIWNIMGSLTNAVLSVVILMLVSRTLDDKQADIFSIAWSISQLMATIGTFQIRTYQATDVEERFKFRQYLIFRSSTVFVMMAISVIYVIVHQYDLYKSSVVFIICLFRAVDSMADVYEGWFQQKERLDLAGKAITYRILVAMVCFGISLIITKELLLSCVVLLLCYIICFVTFNMRYTWVVDVLKKREGWAKHTKWFSKLIMEGAPLFINAYIMMSITNEPKMLIDSAIEQGRMGNGQQMVFSILFMPASVLTLAYIVFRPLLTRMAIMWRDGKIKSFLKIIAIIVGALLGISLVLLGGSAFLGIPILSIIYGVDLTPYKLQLLVIVIGGCFCTFSYVFDNALVVIRKQHLLIISYIVTWIYVKLVSTALINRYKIMGAAFSYTSAMFVFFVSVALVFFICLNKATKEIKKDI